MHSVLLALVVLTALSSCTMKKTLEAQLGMEVHQQLNPFKSSSKTLSSCEIDVVEWAKIHHANTGVNLQWSPALLPFGKPFTPVLKEEGQHPTYFSSYQHFSNRPLYLLFGKLKICA